MEGDPCLKLGTQKEQSWGLGNQGPIIHQGSQGYLGATWRRSMATGICGLAGGAGTAVCVFPQWERMTALREGAESRSQGARRAQSPHPPCQHVSACSPLASTSSWEGQALLLPSPTATPVLSSLKLSRICHHWPHLPFQASLSPQKCHSPVNLLGFFWLCVLGPSLPTVPSHRSI